MDMWQVASHATALAEQSIGIGNWQTQSKTEKKQLTLFYTRIN
jgi:hypothetical protein